MRVEIREPDLSSYEPLVRLRMDRLPRLVRKQAEWPFVHRDAMEVCTFHAAYDGDTLLGWANIARWSWFPPGIALINLTVAAAHEGTGVGGALYRTLLETLPDGIETLGTAVDDAETTSLEIARGWGFRVNQHGIESELELT